MNPAEVDPALVEKAARAAYYADPLYRSVFGKILQPPEVLPWDELSLDDIQAYRSNARHVLAAVLPEVRAQAKVEAVTEARKVISQYLATAEKWRYDRVMWAFAIMLGEIPEDTPCPGAAEQAARIREGQGA